MNKGLFFTGLSFFIIEFLSILGWILIASGITSNVLKIIVSVLLVIGLNVLFGVVMLKGIFGK